MERFLIELSHEPDRASCERAIEVFLKSGSHFLTHADWGCKDGNHKAWIIAEVENKEEARRIVPPAHRAQSKVTLLTRFDVEPSDEMRIQHQQV